MNKFELEAIKRRVDEIADRTIGRGYAGSDERLFANWAHELACLDMPKLIAEVERLRGLLKRVEEKRLLPWRDDYTSADKDIAKLRTEIREALGEE